METYGFTPRLRGLLKKLFLIGSTLFLVFGASTTPLAIIALNTSAWTAGHYPPDWKVLVNHGRPEIEPCKDDDVACLHLRSVKASFALERSVDVDPAQLPFLAWRWKVTHLPGGADFRHSSTDDQAAQVLVGFADRRVLTYLWDSSAPKGTMASASSLPLVHIFAVVCESGGAQANRWIQESRNLAEDYMRAYGKPAPRVKGLRIQINSQHTGTVAESYFGEVAFRNTPQ